MSGLSRATPASELKRARSRSTTTQSRRAVDLSSRPDRSAKTARTYSQLASQASARPSSTLSSRDTQLDFRLSIDFGTKFTSIAWVKGSETGNDIFTIDGFPDDPLPDRAGTQVPTEIAYLRKKSKGQGKEEQTLTKRLYGYEIQERREGLGDDHSEEDYEEVGHVTNVKLLLDKSSHLKHLRKGLLNVLKKLKTEQVVAKNERVIYDLLVYYLRHAKDILQRDHGLNESSNVEITFCVPVCWNPSSNATMSACLQEAMKKVQIGVDSSGICNLFMVNEAEAAAMYALSSELPLKWGDVITVVDCSGGTTDTGSFTIRHEWPFRLGREVTPAQGAVCGSGDVNTRFYDFANLRLKDARLFRRETVPIESIITFELLPKFENRIKRSFSLRLTNKDGEPSYAFRLIGLQGIAGNPWVKNGSFVLSFEDMKSIFMPSLVTIANLMERQIVDARAKNANVDKVILVGGFGDSPALKEFLADTLARINQENKTDIKLIVCPSNTGAAGVAKGALLRAQNKENGPSRVPHQSIGIYQHVRYEDPRPEEYSQDVYDQAVWPASAEDGDEYICNTLWEKSPEDGYEYINNTLLWLLKKGEGVLGPLHEKEWVHVHYFNPSHRTAWPVKYELFASDECTEDYFTRSHVKNYGKTHKIGQVEFDLWVLKEFHELHVPENGGAGEPRYPVTVRFKMTLIDKHLDFTAYWPAEGQPRITLKGFHKHINVITVLPTGSA